MNINSINAFNTNPLHFGGHKKHDNSMKKSAQAMILATALSGMAGACDKLEVEHNHYFDLPTDTFVKKELVPATVPPQVIYIETEKPGKTDTIFKEKIDTVFVDKLVTDTIFKNDTIHSIDTIRVNDTIFVQGKPDTVIVQLPPEIVHDTLRLPGQTIYIKEDWKSIVPPKQKALYNKLGITRNGNGDFILSTAYFDRKNNVLVQRQLNGQASSRDGKILVYNVVKTGWDHEAEGVTLGKNEKFEKHLVYLSEDGNELGMKILSPKVDPKIKNNNKVSNWGVFENGTLSTPDAWDQTDAFFATSKGNIINMTNGFSVRRANRENAVTVTNPYQSEWDLIDWNVVEGSAD